MITVGVLLVVWGVIRAAGVIATPGIQDPSASSVSIGIGVAFIAAGEFMLWWKGRS